MLSPSEIQTQGAFPHSLSFGPFWCPVLCLIGLGADVEQLPIWIPQQEPTAPDFSMDFPVPLPCS